MYETSKSKLAKGSSAEQNPTRNKEMQIKEKGIKLESAMNRRTF